MNFLILYRWYSNYHLQGTVSLPVLTTSNFAIYPLSIYFKCTKETEQKRILFLELFFFLEEL